MTVTAYLALGSNLGDRRDYLDRAVQMLRDQPGIQVSRVSRYHETEPVGGPPGQGAYLNAVAEIQTDWEPGRLLELLLEVERTLGRVRAERFGPRTLDLDLLLYDQLILDAHTLTVPHPRMHERAFVLEPLAEIAPHALHPKSGLTAAQLLTRLQATPLPASPCPPGKELAGLRALVTGSTSGIGRAMVLELATGGADVMVHGRRSAEAARQLAEEVASHGVRSQFFLADVRRVEECRALAERAWGEWDGLDVWVNNAGADTLTGEAADWPFERKLEELLAVDVTATALLSRDVGQRMKIRGAGVLVNVGWDQADTGMEGDSGQLFGAAKAAVMAFSKSLALTLAPEVRVNCLAPGWIRTAWGATASARWQQRVVSETPLRRWGRPEDIAAAVRWLASPAAAFITGQVLRINGGAVR